jgi:hypothetical protein
MLAGEGWSSERPQPFDQEPEFGPERMARRSFSCRALSAIEANRLVGP